MRKNGAMPSHTPSTAPQPRPGRPAMPRGQIVEAALELVDESGADEFSLRALAKRLHSSTATLYRHFTSKDELLAAAGEYVLGEARLALPAAGNEPTTGGGARRAGRDPWGDSLFAAADTLYATFAAHPHMVPVFGGGIALGPNALALREYVLAALLSGGFTPEVAGKAFTSVMHFTVGFCAQLSAPDPSAGEAGQELRDTFAALDPSEFPAIVAAAPHLPTPLREEFHFGLDCLIAGLAQLKD